MITLKADRRLATFIRRTVLTALLLGLTAFAEASPYTVNWGDPWGGSGADHWDAWQFTYTPGSGWSSTMMWGDNWDVPGSLQILAKDGTSGQTVNVKLEFEVSIYSQLLNPFEISDDYNAINNFAGFSSGAVRKHFSVYIDGPSDSGTDILLERAFNHNGTKKYSVTLPYVIGLPEDDIPTVYPNVGGHTMFYPEGLAVHDYTRPAVFFVEAGVTVWQTGAKVVGVPDHGVSAIMLGAVFLGLFWVRRSREVS